MKEITRKLEQYLNSLTTPIMAEVSATTKNEQIMVTITEPDGVDELLLLELETMNFINNYPNLQIQNMTGTDPLIITITPKEKEKEVIK